MPKTQDQMQDPKPLTREALKMVGEYRKYRHGKDGKGIYRAAEKAGIPKTRALSVFQSIAFQEELDRQDEAVRTERAKTEVRAEELTIDFANRELMRTIKQLDNKDDVPQRMEALRLVYVVTGKIQSGSTRILDTPPPREGSTLHDPESQPPERFDYRALIRVDNTTPVPIVPPAAEQSGQVPAPGEALRDAVRKLTQPVKNSDSINKPAHMSPREEPIRKTKDGLPPPIRCG